MTRAAVLMYHALYRTEEELLAIDAEDRPYAVQFDEFVRQLDLIASLNRQVLSLKQAADGGPNRPFVVLSFDDGHESNYTLAYPELARRGWPGIFLVTTDFIGSRPGFCNWRQLRTMAHDGMIIGSHGQTHRFLDALPDGELERELSASASAIGKETGIAADCISFPGGRYDRRSLRIGASLGWRWFMTSEVGDNDPGRFARGGCIRRIALRNATRCEDLRALLCDGHTLRKAVMIERAKRTVRRLLGNRLYHALYKRIAA